MNWWWLPHYGPLFRSCSLGVAGSGSIGRSSYRYNLCVSTRPVSWSWTCDFSSALKRIDWACGTLICYFLFGSLIWVGCRLIRRNVDLPPIGDSIRLVKLGELSGLLLPRDFSRLRVQLLRIDSGWSMASCWEFDLHLLRTAICDLSELWHADLTVGLPIAVYAEERRHDRKHVHGSTLAETYAVEMSSFIFFRPINYNLYWQIVAF